MRRRRREELEELETRVDAKIQTLDEKLEEARQLGIKLDRAMDNARGLARNLNTVVAAAERAQHALRRLITSR